MRRVLIRGLAALCVMLTPRTGAADDSPQAAIDYTWRHGCLKLRLPDRTVTFTLHSASAVEVVCQPHDRPANPAGHAIATAPRPPPAELRATPAGLEIVTDGLRIDIQQAPWRVRYRFRERALIDEVALPAPARGPAFRFAVAPGEKLYGGGSRAFGRMNRRGQRLALYNSASYAYETNAPLMYYSMPAVVSSKKCLLVFDNGARGWMDLDSAGDGSLSFGATGGRQAYVVIAGESWKNLARQVADTTGHQPLLPRWALGHLSSRMAYHTQAEVESIVAAQREAGFPLDAVVLDLFWFGSSIFGNMGNLDWDRAAFPQPRAMLQRLEQQGVRTILITEPLVLTASKNWTNAVQSGSLATRENGEPYTFTSFFGEAALIDVFKPAARKWFWSFLRRHTRSGVAGWWGDLGEPETHPDDIRHVTGRGEDVHNLYGHAWAGVVYEGFRRDFPRQRPFILMRSGFIGTQRHGILPWSGDVARTWGGLKPQVELTLQMGLQGVGYMHSDLGGFAGNRRDPELYTRWLQFGAFQPIFRPHGHEEVPSEPVFWDEATQHIVRRYVELRYRLLPYNYTLMYENAVYGLPLARPLFYAGDEERFADCVDTFLWGDAFLIAPVTDPGATERSIPLPAGPAWFDFWTGKRYEGGGTITVPVTLENIPVLVRAGSFVPMIDPVPNTKAYDGSALWVHVYADDSAPESSGLLYDDDGHSFDAVAKKRHEVLRFHSSRSQDGSLLLRVAGERHPYRGRPRRRTLNLVVHGLRAPPEVVHVDGREVAVGAAAPGKAASDTAAWVQNDGLPVVSVVWSGAPRTILLGHPPPP